MATVGLTPLRLSAIPDLVTNIATTVATTSDYNAKPRAPVLPLNPGIPRFNSETRHPTGYAHSVGNQYSSPTILLVFCCRRPEGTLTTSVWQH